MEVFDEMDMRPPMVISLAQREEEVYIQARTAPVRLPRNNPALRILQQANPPSRESDDVIARLQQRLREFLPLAHREMVQERDAKQQVIIESVG